MIHTRKSFCNLLLQIININNSEVSKSKVKVKVTSNEKKSFRSMTRERCVLVIQTSDGHVKSMTHSVKKIN